MTTIAVYGGAFSPPHLGHALVASWILMSGQADRVLLVPSFAHPFGKEMGPFEERVALCWVFAKDIHPTAVAVSPIEASLPTPSYTINQLRRLRDLCDAGTRLRCVMGADNLVARDKWFGFEDIEREFDPIFVQRAGVVLPDGVSIASPLLPNISSTDIRQRMSAGLPVEHLLTKGVAEKLARK